MDKDMFTLKTHDPARKNHPYVRNTRCRSNEGENKLVWPSDLACFGGAPYQSWSVRILYRGGLADVLTKMFQITMREEHLYAPERKKISPSLSTPRI